MEEFVHRFRSEYLGNERTIWIRPARDPAKTFALAVFLDAELYRDRVGALAIIDQLDAEALIANSLCVFVSMESAESRWRECPCHPPFAEFINWELVPWLERLYPSLTTVSRRALIGLSYTGLAAAFIASSPINRFNRIIAQSGSFWWNDCWLFRQFQSANLSSAADFYLDVGLGETATNVRHKEDVLQVVSQIVAVRQFKDALVSQGLNVKFIEYEGGHDCAAWQKTLPAALQWALPNRA